jgi:hypothetical protein
MALHRRPSEDIRIARLSGLAKVWGTVKYFHPYLAYREIDWDKALIEAIPKVNAAKSPRLIIKTPSIRCSACSTTKALAQRLKATPKTETAGQPVKVAANPVRTDNGVVVIDAMAIAQTLSQDSSQLAEYHEKHRTKFIQLNQRHHRYEVCESTAGRSSRFI